MYGLNLQKRISLTNNLINFENVCSISSEPITEHKPKKFSLVQLGPACLVRFRTEAKELKARLSLYIDDIACNILY